jgi:hypothetical protein
MLTHEVRKGYAAFDGAKFRRDIELKGLKMAQLSRYLGRGSTFVGDAVRSNICNVQAFTLLCKEYDLNLDDYLIKEPLTTTQPTQPTQPVGDSTELLTALNNITEAIDRLTAVISADSKNINSIESSSKRTAFNTLKLLEEFRGDVKHDKN